MTITITTWKVVVLGIFVVLALIYWQRKRIVDWMGAALELFIDLLPAIFWVGVIVFVVGVTYAAATSGNWPGKWHQLQGDLQTVSSEYQVRCVEDFVTNVAPHTKRLSMRGYSELVNRFSGAEQTKVQALVSPFVDDPYVRDPNASRYKDK